MAGHRVVDIPASNLKKRITEILYNQVIFLEYKFEDDNKQGVIKIALKYNTDISCRLFKASKEEPSKIAPVCKTIQKNQRKKKWLGIASSYPHQEVMTDKDALSQNIVEKFLCYIY